jgi:hypothetical protein
MANSLIGSFGDHAVSGIELRDHDGKLEIIPTGQFEYAMLSYKDSAELAKAITVFLLDHAARICEDDAEAG